jgi:hypothetical protein
VPVGRLENGVLRITLEAGVAAWQPWGKDGPTVRADVFAADGTAPRIPGPLIRVTAGTPVHITCGIASRTRSPSVACATAARTRRLTSGSAPSSTVSWRSRQAAYRGAGALKRNCPRMIMRWRRPPRSPSLWNATRHVTPQEHPMWTIVLPRRC